MEVVSFRIEPEHTEKLKRMATQTGWTPSEILRHLVHVADVAPVTFIQTQPVIKNSGTPDRAPLFDGISGTGQSA